ncbi:hypothetical protein ACFPOE_19570 [Caenimonas terrae]|uniref:Uncharacterized protein n=1 Tax=Caenimonas terrae TaxID=696074 RepID=A0ABW0NIC3_9BURK
MFERIKKAFTRASREDDKETVGPPSQMAAGPMSEWASTRGFGFSSADGGGALGLEGKIGGKRWRMELGRPTRNFIRGEELRGRAELGIDEDAAVLVLNRTLKEALDKQAYSIYTDHLQTSVDPKLPEEMRWLAMYDEVGWDELPAPFWERYAVLADRRENALAWVDGVLATAMLEWPRPGPDAETPFMLMLLRGKGYMRMEYRPPNMATLQHAALIFTTACENALGGLATPVKRP